MLKRAFGTTNYHQHYYQGAAGWKIRPCYGFLILIILSIAIILFAWNMICGLPTTTLLPSFDQIGRDELMMNQSGGPSGRTKDGRHIVEIYYEVLCPDSRYFVKEFIPVYNQLKDFIKPNFVPYGKATTTKSKEGKLSFSCQHGEAECQGNIIHACAITHVADEVKAVQYIGCMITNNREPEGIGQKCAEDLGINWTPIYQCFKGTQGSELLKFYGDLTHSLRPKVSFIPTIVIDGSQKGQKEILKNFKSYVCSNTLAKEQPKAC